MYIKDELYQDSEEEFTKAEKKLLDTSSSIASEYADIEECTGNRKLRGNSSTKRKYCYK